MPAQQDPKQQGRSLARRIKLPDVCFAYPRVPAPGEIRAGAGRGRQPALCDVRGRRQFAITVPMDRIRKSLGARVSATDSAVKPVVPVLTAVP